MKKIIVFILSVIVFTSCEKTGLIQESDVGLKTPVIADYFIQKDEAIREAFEFFGKPLTKGMSDIVAESIDREGEVIAYSVDLPEGGWALLSADKRIQTVLAYNESGDFETSSLRSGPAGLWFDDVCSDLLALRMDAMALRDSPHLKKWGKKECPAGYVTKGGGEEHENEWLQLVYTVREEVEECNVNHLITTQWGQGSPWNQLAPFNGENSNIHCYTGCVATALAQLSYYLHYQIGKPQFLPSDVRYAGWYPGNYTLEVRSYSDTLWSHVPLSINDVCYDKPSYIVASLMSEIVCIMGQGNSWSDFLFSVFDSERKFGSAQWNDIKSYLEEKNIGYTLHTSDFFDPSVVSESIQMGMPVLVSAYTRQNSSREGHCWIIDGAVVRKTYDTYYNQWMPMGTFPPVEQEAPDWNHLDNYVISEPVCVNTEYYFRMNWGWDGNYDSTLYYYGSNWTAGGYNFQYKRNMMYNFY